MTASIHGRLTSVVGSLSLGAAALHFAAAAQHLDTAWYHSVFFATVGWLQLGFGMGLLVSHLPRRVLVAAALGNAGVMVVWLVSRTVGLPFGPEAGAAEPVAFIDALATTFEGIVVIGLVVLLRPAVTRERPPASPPRRSIAVAGTGVAALTILALSPALADDDSGHGHGSHSVVIAADGTSACERSGFRSGASGHGHRGPAPFQPVDRSVRTRLAPQEVQAAAAAARFPTVRAGLAAGYVEVTQYQPCTAAHFIKYAALQDGFDPSEPEVLLFTGTAPDSELVGLSYVQVPPTGEAPEGFAGPNDVWHVHSSFCLRGGVILDGTDPVGDAECARLGGRRILASNAWMLHMWNVPGWTNRWGLFASEHPDLGGELGRIDA